MQWDTATRYKLLLRINNDIVSASTRRAAFSAIAQSLGEIFHFDRLSINLFDEKTYSLSYFAAAEGISPTEISEDARPLAKGAIASAVIRSREPFIISWNRGRSWYIDILVYAQLRERSIELVKYLR